MTTLPTTRNKDMLINSMYSEICCKMSLLSLCLMTSETEDEISQLSIPCVLYTWYKLFWLTLGTQTALSVSLLWLIVIDTPHWYIQLLCTVTHYSLLIWFKQYLIQNDLIGPQSQPIFTTSPLTVAYLHVLVGFAVERCFLVILVNPNVSYSDLWLCHCMP